MNIKFRMPKFQKMTSKGGVVKEMTMTIIATSISIILTFGTAMWLESRQKQANGRQMAMMVICDIEDNIQTFNDLAKWEKEHLELARYVENHLDQINQISFDTLHDVYRYLLEDNIYTIDDSKEHIFNSSQDTWKNIDNPMFISIVQSFYLDRREWKNCFDTDVVYRSPLSKEEAYQMMTSTNTWEVADMAAMIKNLMSLRKVKLYLDFSASRSAHIYSGARSWQQKSDQLKFIMGITDEEMKEYLHNQQRRGSPVSDKQLFGIWTVSSAIGDVDESFEFSNDHRFVHLYKEFYSIPGYTGKLSIVGTLTGTWHIEGDSLFRDYESEDYTLDKSHFTYGEDKKEEVKDVIGQHEYWVAERNKRVQREGTNTGRSANTVFIDRSESKIELGRTTVDDEGNETTNNTYLVRKK